MSKKTEKQNFTTKLYADIILVIFFSIDDLLKNKNIKIFLDFNILFLLNSF